ncbi:MAG: hypothetical protein QM778_22925 [Myxococcales bacterium]
MRGLRALGIGCLAWAALSLAADVPTASQLTGPATARAEEKQSVLGPGLYIYQQRVREATCKDAEPDGYVLSFMAAIDGVPGSVTMTMQLVNTAYFKEWTLKVMGSQVVGESRLGKTPDSPDAHFEVTRDGDRFKGTGFRTYNGSFQGKPQRCKVSYDALLKRLDS